MSSGEEQERFDKYVAGTRATFLGAPKSITEALAWAAAGLAGTGTIGLLVLELASLGLITLPE